MLVPNSGFEMSSHRVVEIRMVESVVRLRAERERQVLFNPDVLHERDVHVEEMRTVDGIARDGAKAGGKARAAALGGIARW